MGFAALDTYRGRTDDLDARMGKAVLPLLSGEWFEVAHLSEEETDAALAGYPEWLDKKLDGKEVIAVVEG